MKKVVKNEIDEVIGKLRDLGVDVTKGNMKTSNKPTINSSGRG